MINCETEFDLLRSIEYITSELSITSAVSGNLDANLHVSNVEAMQTTAAIFQKNNATLYVSVVTLSVNDDAEFLENTKQSIKSTTSWNNIDLK